MDYLLFLHVQELNSILLCKESPLKNRFFNFLLTSRHFCNAGSNSFNTPGESWNSGINGLVCSTSRLMTLKYMIAAQL